MVNIKDLIAKQPPFLKFIGVVCLVLLIFIMSMNGCAGFNDLLRTADDNLKEVNQVTE